jgi:hypothetical protein
LKFVTHELCEALHSGNPLPVAAIHSAIEQMIADAIHEAVQDAQFPKFAAKAIRPPVLLLADPT